MFLTRLQIGFAILLTGTAYAQTVAPRQNPDALRPVVEQFLTVQSAGLPGKAEITVGAIDKRLNLAECPAPQAFFSNGGKAWGKTTVGVRCTAPTAWTVYIPATVRIHNDYVVAAIPLPQGHVIQSGDIALVNGDLTRLPSGVLTNKEKIIGQTVARSVPVGSPIRPEALKIEKVIQQGQTVRLISAGPGFQVSSEGQAITNAALGQVAKAKTASGQIVRGIAKEGGVIDLSF